QSVPFAPARRVLYRWLSLEGLRDLLHRPNLRNARAPLSMGTHLSMAIGRAAVVGLGLIIGVGARATGYRLTRPPAAPLLARPRRPALHAWRPRSQPRGRWCRRGWRPRASGWSRRARSGSSTATACASTPG